MKSVWIVDDDESIRWVLKKALERENIALKSFSSADEALVALETETPQVMVSDIRMPGTSGLHLLEVVKNRFPHLPIVVMTAFSDLDSAVSAFQGGAFDYLAKPFDLAKAVDLVKRALKESGTEVTVDTPVEKIPEMIGQAPAMQEVFRAIGKLSRSHATVLITGESGSGKELVAKALHRHSPRAMQPFVALNMAAIPRDLLESELFGHERGAFTGAQVMRRGRFEQAEGGTLFLDEIGDMPLDTQTRLLRVLSDGHFYRVGGSQLIRADVRVIAATHQPLERLVREGTFREDLFHRLNVIRLRLPGLRERPEDIPVLARHFLKQSAKQLGVEPKRLSQEAAGFLEHCRFSGNVRQLENLCHWFTVMVTGKTIEMKDVPAELLESDKTGNEARQGEKAVSFSGATGGDGSDVSDASAVPAGALSEEAWEIELEKTVGQWLDRGQNGLMDALGNRFERVLIKTALKYAKGRKNEAALLLGIGRNTIARKIQELGVDEKDEV